MTTPPLRDTVDSLDALIGITPGHPLWSSTDAGDIPRLLTEIDTLRQALADKDAAAWQMVTAYADLKVEADILARAVKDRDAEIERLRAAVEGRGQTHDTI